LTFKHKKKRPAGAAFALKQAEFIAQVTAQQQQQRQQQQQLAQPVNINAHNERNTTVAGELDRRDDPALE
jgi:hypothetical protein